ncbi:MAG: glycosyl transferase family 1, partial [Bryobacteraceae bacterium]
MKVAVVNNGVPFVKGGAEYLADSLTRKLEEFGHQAILVRIPFAWEPPNKIVESMLACRLLRIPNVDRVIALKFPAYYIPHPEKVLWLLHQFRQAYDLWGTPFQGLPNSPEGLAIREAIIKTDNTYLTQVRKIYTNSEVTSKRLMTFNGIDSTVLYPPLLETTHFTCDGYGDYVYFPSRITQSKRQHLAVESMRYVRSNTRLIVSGKEEAPEDLVRIEKLIKDHRLAARVTIINRFISEKEKSDLFSKALGCVYIPYDEDSYGYVTLESYHARK